MPLQSQEQETLNVKLVHFTKQNSPDEPVQVAFSVTDEQGKEEIITGEIPYTHDLFRVFQENGWLRRNLQGVAPSCAFSFCCWNSQLRIVWALPAVQDTRLCPENPSLFGNSPCSLRLRVTMTHGGGSCPSCIPL